MGKTSLLWNLPAEVLALCIAAAGSISDRLNVLPLGDRPVWKALRLDRFAVTVWRDAAARHLFFSSVAAMFVFQRIKSIGFRRRRGEVRIQ